MLDVAYDVPDKGSSSTADDAPKTASLSDLLGPQANQKREGKGTCHNGKSHSDNPKNRIRWIDGETYAHNTKNNNNDSTCFNSRLVIALAFKSFDPYVVYKYGACHQQYGVNGGHHSTKCCS